MHVWHPKPETLNPSFYKYGKYPAASRYSITTFDPGDKEVLIYGATVSPLSTAFFAT